MPTAVTKHSVSISERSRTTLTGEELISFISGCQTNIGRATFYNLKEEQQKILFDQHIPILEQARPFYTLISLSQGINDVNKQLIAWNLIKQTLREENLKDNQHSPTTIWENEVILQSFDSMPVPRVLDFIVNLANKKLNKKRAVFLVREWLVRNKESWPLWTIKYRSDFRKTLRFVLRHSRKTRRPIQLQELYRYLKFDEVKDTLPELVKDYEAVKSGDKTKLSKLPVTVAEGFIQKFGMKKEDFDKLFVSGGGKFTTKEKQLRATSVEKSGVSTDFDMEKSRLFDLLVYLYSLDKNKMPPKDKIETLLEKKAKEMAHRLSFNLDKVGVILDTSKSMQGTKDQPFHPMLRALAISMILKQVSNEFKEYRTNESEGLFPKLCDQSNYASAVMRALKDGCETIIILGDGYENAPFEGALHQLLFTYKKTLDKNNKLMVIHFNPVFAAEAKDVRSITSLASQVGIRQIEGLNEAMFLAVAKSKPMLAIQKYLRYLVNLQNKECKQLMPEAVQKLITAKNLEFISS